MPPPPQIVIILAILTNTVVLCVQNPANTFDADSTLLLTVLDLILSLIFTLVSRANPRSQADRPRALSRHPPSHTHVALLLLQEMCIKIRAMGFLGHRGYLDVRKAVTAFLCHACP